MKHKAKFIHECSRINRDAEADVTSSPLETDRIAKWEQSWSNSCDIVYSTFSSWWYVKEIVSKSEFNVTFQALKLWISDQSRKIWKLKSE